MVYSKRKMAAPMKLVHAPVSWDSLAWSEDNRIAIACEKCVNIFCLECDPSERNGNFQFEKLVIQPCRDILEFDVGINMKKLDKAEIHHYLVQCIQMDRTLTPPPPSSTTQEVDPDKKGFKLVRWSPVSTQVLDRALLACLTLDHRLTIYKRISKKGNFTMIVDLSLVLGKLLTQQGFTHMNEEQHPTLPSNPKLAVKCKEFKRRVYMLAAVTMDWSSITRTTSDPSETERLSSNETSEYAKESFLLLAAAMKSGHVVIWKIRTLVENETDISLYSVFDSGYQWPASISWCRLTPPQSTSRASKACLAVGDREGCISIWTIQEESASTRSFLKCLDVWPDKDLISVCNMAWTYSTPSEASTGTATLIATKGLYLLAFLIDLGSMTVVRQTHTPCQHTVPATSLCVSGSMVVTTSTTGSIYRAVIDWTKPDEVLKIEVLEPPNSNIKSLGIALSPHGIFTACPSILRMGKKKPHDRSMSFCTVSKMDAVMTALLDSRENLSQKMDLLEYIRQSIINSSDSFPAELESIINGEIKTKAGPGEDDVRDYGYMLRLRRFLLLMKLSKVQGLVNKVLDAGSEREEQLLKMESDIQEIERNLTKLHIVSALQSWQGTQASQPGNNAAKAISDTVPLLLMADWLSAHGETTDEPIRDLVTEVYNTVPILSEVGKRESCDLCGEFVPCTSLTSGACTNGHGWYRCQLSLQLCQTTSIPRECLHCDAIALPVQNQTDSVWLRRLLQQQCVLCESIFVPLK